MAPVRCQVSTHRGVPEEMRGRRVRLVRPGVGQNWHTVVETGPARGSTYILNQSDFTRCNRDGKTWSLGDASGATYRTFKRAARNWEEFSHARKTTIDRGLTYDEARRQCQAFNASLTPAQIRKGLKCEFMSE